jgi:large subunit ribosomal protein L18
MKTIRRRRLENKTDYRSRFHMLKSEKPRLVIRRTNRYLIAQIVESDLAQDKIILGVSSKDLIAKGWPKELSGSLKSRAAAYLTGYLLAKKSKGKVKEAILDLGLQRNIVGSRLYALLKGAVDGGLSIPHSAESLPSLDLITSNEKLGKHFNTIKEKI